MVCRANQPGEHKASKGQKWYGGEERPLNDKILFQFQLIWRALAAAGG